MNAPQSHMPQEWFEMTEIRKRKLEKAVWIPLRSDQKLLSISRYGYLGYKEEYLGVSSVAVPVSTKASVEQASWMDFGLSRSHRPWVQDGAYKASDVFDIGNKEYDGVPLVLDQDGNTEESREWHLHQDFVIALKLKREGDLWVGFDESYMEIARLHRRDNKIPYLLEVRAEHLKDYLCARAMALYVTSFRSRKEVVIDTNHIIWKEDFISETIGGDRWEGRKYAIHEGGNPFGTSTAVMHVSRKDVDPEEDVPNFGFPSDDSVISKSWTKTDKGQKLYVITGELWRTEWIEPGMYSSRIRDDEQPPTVFFIIDSSGTRANRETLKAGSRWLWFKPDAIMALAHRRGGSLYWYTRDTGSVRCSPDYGVHFGVNKLGLVNVYAKDIALLPDWQQNIWAGFNVGPEGGVSEELLASQMRADPASTTAPEQYLPKVINLLNDIALERFGFRILRGHEQIDTLLAQTHRFRSVDTTGFFSLAKDLARLTADSIDAAALQKIVAPPKGTKWGSLKTLETLLGTKLKAEEARLLLGPLVGIFELRHADAHLPSSQLDDAIKLAGVNPTTPFVFQGFQLLDACVSTLYEIANVLKTIDYPGK